jgi:hypothetical protein
LMLASTVQFSRYGRAGPGSSRARRRRGMSANQHPHSAMSRSTWAGPLLPKPPRWCCAGVGEGREVRATIARSLRTQQRAEADHPRPSHVPAASGCTR